MLGFQPWSAGYPDRALEEGSGALFPRPMIAFGVELKNCAIEQVFGATTGLVGFNS